MRDIILCAVFVAAIPFMLRRPSLGVIMWVWLSVMNPHRLTYGFAYDLPFAATAAGITFIGLLMTKEKRQLPLTPPTVMLALFMLWMCITSLFPFHPDSGYNMWSRVMKILLMTFVALAVIHDKKQIHWFVWIVCFSLGFYGLKGGVFTLANGGNYLVWGPAGSFIEGNNEVALALVIVIPLLRYVQLQLQKKWQRWFLGATMLFSALAAIGSHSRGALLAIAAMGGFMWLKSRNKFGMGLVLAVIGVGIVAFMPSDWMERMNTIGTYQEDESAMGRINAWQMAFNMARHNFFGGGYEIYDYDTFARYAPNPLDVHAAHSIYFQVLGEHGFIGLFLFLGIGTFTWIAAGEAKRKTRGIPELAWAGQLLDMCKVSMVGYAVGGAFLSLAYFDVPYYVLVIVVATRALVVATAKEKAAETDPGAHRRRDRFGVVAVDSDTVIGAPPDVRPDPAHPRPRRDEWRGQRGFSHDSIGFKPGRGTS